MHEVDTRSLLCACVPREGGLILLPHAGKTCRPNGNTWPSRKQLVHSLFHLCDDLIHRLLISDNVQRFWILIFFVGRKAVTLKPLKANSNYRDLIFVILCIRSSDCISAFTFKNLFELQRFNGFLTRSFQLRNFGTFDIFTFN